MEPRDGIVFVESFRLDIAEQRLWQGSDEIVLRPKAFALFQHMVQHSGRLLTKKELLDAVWPGMSVSDAVLKVCISEIRRALGTRNGGSRLIETRHRRGYRLVAPTRELGSAVGQTTEKPRLSTNRLIGHGRELANLHDLFDQACRGQRQTVFVTGEAGIGKTSLVEAFLQQLPERQNAWVCCGQCFEQHGSGEAYGPVLEALSHLCRTPAREKLIPLLVARAPTWLAQMPGAFAMAGQSGLRPGGGDLPRGRMLREMTEAMEFLTLEQPFVLALEDLHWADVHTLDLMASLARHREPARLLLIGTSPTPSTLESAHPMRDLKRDLQARGRCSELPVECFGIADVASFLNARFAQSDFPEELAALVWNTTEGNPWFVSGVSDDLVARNIIVNRGSLWQLMCPPANIDVRVPDDVAETIQEQIDRLDRDERQLLQAASVAGLVFTGTDLAAALAEDPPSIEDRCHTLARSKRYLRSADETGGPDAVEYFRFIHRFYKDVLVQDLSPRLRTEWHTRIEAFRRGTPPEPTGGLRPAADGSERRRAKPRRRRVPGHRRDSRRGFD